MFMKKNSELLSSETVLWFPKSVSPVYGKNSVPEFLNLLKLLIY